MSTVKCPLTDCHWFFHSLIQLPAEIFSLAKKDIIPLSSLQAPTLRLDDKATSLLRVLHCYNLSQYTIKSQTLSATTKVISSLGEQYGYYPSHQLSTLYTSVLIAESSVLSAVPDNRLFRNQYCHQSSQCPIKSSVVSVHSKAKSHLIGQYRQLLSQQLLQSPAQSLADNSHWSS